MMNHKEREEALSGMRQASAQFYRAAVRIGNHPFIEFTGLLNEYIKICEVAHHNGIDFSECNTHSGKVLPMEDYMVKYINEKLECIFQGQSIMCEGDMRKTVEALGGKRPAADRERLEANEAAIRKSWEKKLNKTTLSV